MGLIKSFIGGSFSFVELSTTCLLTKHDFGPASGLYILSFGLIGLIPVPPPL